ncbi:proteasome adapter and scaffold protein ECM29-like [Physella acuta]|uniref:proteasome adapter and scaffold protein ECM29-like n=1 Tax=Physella acuta TaxID=109671 RepID=UPI0027DAC939|nr:proteasome adapter and scaffold protein ECM29-like [Physella acuta]
MTSQAQDENALVERVFLRIGSAESDEQLQTALGKFLAPLILKLNSSDEAVRSKVLKLLAHIKTRLKSRSQVKLPLDALLTQFQDPKATPFITNFTILFIKLGYPRVEPEKQADLIPLLINCLDGRSTNHQDSILQLLIPALQHLKMPKTEAECRARFQLRDKPTVQQLLLDYFMDVLLLPYNSHVSAIAATEDSDLPNVAPPPAVPPPPGLSVSSFRRLTAENPLVPEQLEKAKLSIITFLGSGVLEEADVVCHFVVASSDTRHSVATSADMELKKITGSIDWNSKPILNKLFSIFQGTVVVKGQPTVKPDDRRSAVSPRIRLKIFPFFLKAREASNMFPACLQIVFECLFGANPNAKLRIMAVEFVHHICLNCDEAKFSMLDVVLLNGMLKVIKEAREDAKLRSLAYVAVGKIARRSPNKLTKDIQVLQTFFDSMCQEEGDTRLAVQEALSLMSQAYCNLDETNKQLLEALLLQNIDKDEPQVRVVTIQYAATVFSSDHFPSRYILMLGAGDLKEDAKLESIKALRGTAGTSQTLPDFVKMVSYVVEKAKQRKESPKRYSAVNASLPFNPASYNEILLYLRMCLSHSAGVAVDWQVENLADQAPSLVSKVHSLLQQYPEDSGPIQQYIALLQELLTVATSSEAMYCLLEIVAVVPESIAVKLSQNLDWLKTLLCSSKDDIKQYAAELYAIVSFHIKSEVDFYADVKTFLGNLVDKNPELGLGALLALGYCIGLKLRQLKTSGGLDMAKEQLLTQCVTTIATLLTDKNISKKSLACLALGEIGRNGPLPLLPGSELVPETEAKQEGEIKDGDITKTWLVRNLVAMIKTSNESNKTKERAASCLGDICVGDENFPQKRKAMEELINAVQSKQVELQFTIGQALVDMAMGPSSSRARCVWTTSKEDHQKMFSKSSEDVKWFLQELLSKYICHSNPFLRQGACVWLLTLIRQAGHHEAIQSALVDIQRGFMRMLSENDEITQDLASKGLGHTMDICTPEQKDTLVSELVETLMTGKSAKNEVSADTTVFQSGALGKAPDGGGLSTYKELCAIATDLNQPDLIYKFMHLANHNATWNTRKGAAFGFSTIAAQAGEQLAPYMTQIVPRLYRYQFDPNPKIQQAMSGIWNALVQDNKKTIDTYLKQILDDLLKNLTSNQWRIRESSCLAVSDLLRGRVLDSVLEDIPKLWETCLRVRDDIKESVRLAANSACQTLSKVSIKLCDVSNGKSGEKATKLILPCLLQCSLHSTVSEVRTIGLSTILLISRNAGALLKPNIPVLVPALLEAVSGLEPDVINYLSLHMGTQAGQDKLDSARIAASKMSPMMETVNRCVQYVDSEVLAELVPRLVELIRGGIGVSTKAGCSSFIVSLVHQCPQDLSAFAGKLLAVFLHGLNDRNATVRKSYATAIGHLVRVAKDSSVEKLIEKLKTWYMESEEPNAHHACCVTLHAMARHSPDHLRRHANLAMPLAFFAMHEEVKKDEGKKSDEPTDWEVVWSEITPGTEAGIRLYLPEIVSLLSASILSQTWSLKSQTARAMATVAQKLGAQLCPPYLDQLLTALLEGLSGRTWEGKEAILKAVSAVCTSCKEEILKPSNNKPSIEQILTAVLRECGKEQPAYKMAAMTCLGSILETYQLDNFNAVWEMTKPVINELSNKTRSEDEEEGNINQKQEMITCVFTLLGEAWPESRSTQDKFGSQYVDLLCDAVPRTTWKVQLIILKNLQKLVKRLIIMRKDELQTNLLSVEVLVNKVLAVSLSNINNIKYVTIRVESLLVIDFILHQLADCNQLSLVSQPLMVQLREELAPIADSGPWELRDRAKVLNGLIGTPTNCGENQPQAMEH